jgi:predicted flavoprotein YhiN
MDFFKTHDLELKEEEEGRVFPITEKSESVVDVLIKCLR